MAGLPGLERHERELAALWREAARGKNPALPALELAGELLVHLRALVVASERLLIATGRRG